MAKNNNLMKKSDEREGRNLIQKAVDSFNDLPTEGKVTVVGIVVGGLYKIVDLFTGRKYRLDTKWFSLRPDHQED